MYFE
jgi:hypothetical protein